MPIATKKDILSIRGPEPLTEELLLPGTDLTITIRGIVRSYERSMVYREIDEMQCLKEVVVDGERIPITEDDIVASNWAAICVRAPVLSAMEWLSVGANNADLLALIGERCLVNSRLLVSEQTPNGVDAAIAEMEQCADPFASLPSGFVSTDSEGFQPNSSERLGAPGSDIIKLTIV